MAVGLTSFFFGENITPPFIISSSDRTKTICSGRLAVDTIGFLFSSCQYRIIQREPEMSVRIMTYEIFRNIGSVVRAYFNFAQNRAKMNCCGMLTTANFMISSVDRFEHFFDRKWTYYLAGF